MSNGKPHIIPFSTYLIILGILLSFTALSVLVTHIDIGNFGIFAALLFATIKTTLVLMYFMHLKYDQKLFAQFVALVVFVFIAVVIITFFDYWFN